ncbi:WAS/WASL-interacting protein family member 2-like [Lutra lutra]|uniref:WAS/WASL-interacting protein family member 2-like n=1 Tax=Lutra lutra TaxID=9657 RepID=UPI001FD5FEBF|nr:WAS/WASL-interacting protein family member 2-like [Lutra lutra]
MRAVSLPFTSGGPWAPSPAPRHAQALPLPAPQGQLPSAPAASPGPGLLRGLLSERNESLLQEVGARLPSRPRGLSLQTPPGWTATAAKLLPRQVKNSPKPERREATAREQGSAALPAQGEPARTREKVPIGPPPRLLRSHPAQTWARSHPRPRPSQGSAATPPPPLHGRGTNSKVLKGRMTGAREGQARGCPLLRELWPCTPPFHPPQGHSQFRASVACNPAFPLNGRHRHDGGPRWSQTLPGQVVAPARLKEDSRAQRGRHRRGQEDATDEDRRRHCPSHRILRRT